MTFWSPSSSWLLKLPINVLDPRLFLSKAINTLTSIFGGWEEMWVPLFVGQKHLSQ